MDSSFPTPNREAEIWARLMRARKDQLSAEAAEFLLSVNFEEEDQRRMLELADRSEAGTLTAEEGTEFDSYLHNLHIGNFLAIMPIQSQSSHQEREPTR